MTTAVAKTTAVANPIEEVTAPEEIFPRADPTSHEHNPRGYTILELKKRDQALEQMMKDYPKCPQQWCEWIYDFCTHEEHHDPEHLKKIINEGLWKKPTKRNWKGGKVKCMENLDISEFVDKYGPTGYDQWLAEQKTLYGENKDTLDEMKNKCLTGTLPA